MPNYNQSTQEMIGNIAEGLFIETATISANTYLANTKQTEVFGVYGRILVKQLYIEVISDLSAQANQMQFNCTFTTPTIAVNAMGAACGSVSGKGQGTRIVHVGGAVATSAVITDSAGLSDVTCVTPHIVGGQGFIGSIGMLGSGGTIATGTVRVCLHYIPYSVGAYAESNL